MNTNEKHHRAILQSIAHRVMIERGLLPDFSNEALAELKNFKYPLASPPAMTPTSGTCGIFHGRPLIMMIRKTSIN